MRIVTETMELVRLTLELRNLERFVILELGHVDADGDDGLCLQDPTVQEHVLHLRDAASPGLIAIDIVLARLPAVYEVPAQGDVFKVDPRLEMELPASCAGIEDLSTLSFDDLAQYAHVCLHVDADLAARPYLLAPIKVQEIDA